MVTCYENKLELLNATDSYVASSIVIESGELH